MVRTLIDFTFNSLQLSNPDGSFATPIQSSAAADAGGSLATLVQAATVTDGPGATPLGNYPKAVDMGKDGRASVQIADLAVDFRQFTLRVVFQANGPINQRQNLIESNRLPFALFLAPRVGTTDFDLVASVAPKAHGWQAATSQFAAGLKANQWYTADLVYDIDTVALFVDGRIVSVHAFPQGRIEQFAGSSLYIGTWVDGQRNHFDGKFAAVQWLAGVPEDLEAALDERREHPEWFITHKLESLRPTHNMGAATSALAYDWAIDAYVQRYDNGALMYHDGIGAAFEIHGTIYAQYQAMPNRAALGYLVSDEERATNPNGRKSVFSKGAIYWSSNTGAVPVLGQLYLDYEALGESRVLGFPTKAAQRIAGGLEQEFQHARMYFKDGDTNAHEVHGNILTKYLALGGPGKWGFPITNESDVRKNGAVVGKFSEFEHCTVYWSGQTGTFEVHGDLRRKYLDLGGPAGELGFPTSDEQDIPGASPGRHNTFQTGSLLWYGSWSSIIIARPFKIFIGRIDSDETEGWGMGQNDLYVKVTLQEGGNTLYSKRHPSDGDFGGKNIIDFNLTIPNVITPNANKTVTLTVDVWDSDPGNDDHIGTWTKVLNMANAWGLRENGGILNSGAFSKINAIMASVKPQVNINSLSEPEKFWGVVNQGTDNLSYSQYASAFSDVDSEAEWWDATDWLEKAFYELVVDNLAANGNCFGMSLEAIYARKNSSLFSLPLNRFTDWNTVRPEFNVKHCYQVGASAIWWFMKEFVTGNTHDPKDVFNRTRAEFNRGNHPVLCVAQNYNFSGAPHCILPVGWDSSTKPWKMTICDPNFPNQLRTLTVNPDDNTFEYVGASTYRGGAWSGGRLHYMPFSVLNKAPRTPIWDAILLILSGTILILGNDAETASITDLNGNDINAFGSRATSQLQNGRQLNGYFVGFKGYDQSQGKGTVAGELLMRMNPTNNNVVLGAGAVSPAILSHLALGELADSRNLRAIRDAVRNDPLPTELIEARTLHRVVNDPAVLESLQPATREILVNAVQANRLGDFRHEVRGVRNGQFHYALKQGLNQFLITSGMATAEQTEVTCKDMDTSKNMLQVKPDRDKLVHMEIDQKLGVGGDRIKVKINQLPGSRDRNLQFNLRPGLGGIDVMPASDRVDAQVEVEANISGSTIRRRFNVPMEGGTRLKVSTMLSDNVLEVSNIDQVFGPSRQVRMIQDLT
ncbi:MAG TPA: LamG-like jellyroll fold domain-containing protein [Leptolyngbyaceae cyanobacterium]